METTVLWSKSVPMEMCLGGIKKRTLSGARQGSCLIGTKTLAVGDNIKLLSQNIRNYLENLVQVKRIVIAHK